MSFRQILMVVALAAVGVVFVGQIRDLLADPAVWPPDDFIEYWSAAKLTLDHQNPYDGNLLLPIQQAGGRDTDEAVMMWNPPWTLTVVLPLGLLPSRGAQLIWFAVNLAATGFCGDRLWRLFGGSAKQRWIGWAIAFTAMPSAFALQSGQVGPLLLLGAVLFLECEQRGYHFAAGAATVLLAIKPHLAYLIWLAILCDAITRNRWRIILGGAVTGIVCSVIPLLFVPQVWSQFADAMGNRPPEQWMSPTIGTVLRLYSNDPKMFWLQFVPVLFGLVWFAFYYLRWAGRWNWTEQVPLLLLVSFVTAPYGAWPFDMVLLLPAAMWLAIGKTRRQVDTETRDPGQGDKGTRGQGDKTVAYSPCLLVSLSPCPPVPLSMIRGGLIAVNVGCLVCNLLALSSYEFRWVSPAVLLLYALGCRQSVSKSANDS